MHVQTLAFGPKPCGGNNCNTGSCVFIMIIVSRHRAEAITLFKSSRAAKSDVKMRRAVASMTAITLAEELVINIDDKNKKWTSKTIFSLDRNQRNTQ